MPTSIALVQPGTVEEAVQYLDRSVDEAKVVAGATAVTIMLRQRLIRPRALVSIAGLPGLGSIEVQDGSIRLGALATHRAVELSQVVRSQIPVLAYAFGVVANVRVRNAAT